ncbi:hypothetical protein [Mesorhizobium sp. M0488]|uniref:hypothetical protein n=1 Tax=unclassified Mesorhizobium TaxID=325217 RepID=UPI00333BB96D
MDYRLGIANPRSRFRGRERENATDRRDRENRRDGTAKMTSSTSTIARALKSGLTNQLVQPVSGFVFEEKTARIGAGRSR